MLKSGKTKRSSKYHQDHSSKALHTQASLKNISLFFNKQQIEIPSDQCILIKEKQNIPSSVKFESALKYLSGQTSPKELVGREKQSMAILRFLKDNIKSKITHSFPLIISGVPGIGKTMSVKTVVEKFAQKTKYPFKIIDINLMKLRSLNDTIPCLFSLICPELKIESCSKAMILESLFLSGKHCQVPNQHHGDFLDRKLLILDQAEFLATESHKQILYCILNWLLYQHTNMLIIFISNKISFNCYQSRMGTQQIVFKPYSSTDMMRIVNNLLQQFDIFEDKAIEYAVKKVAVCSSDIRKVIYLLTSSIKLCMQENKYSNDYYVTLKHIKKCYNDIYKGATFQMIKILQPKQKLLLICICNEIKISSRQYTDSHTIFRSYRQSVVISEDELNYMLAEIMGKGMIKMKERSEGHVLVYRVELRIESDCIIKALEEEPWVAPFLYQLLR